MLILSACQFTVAISCIFPWHMDLECKKFFMLKVSWMYYSIVGIRIYWSRDLITRENIVEIERKKEQSFKEWWSGEREKDKHFCSAVTQ